MCCVCVAGSQFYFSIWVDPTVFTLDVLFGSIGLWLRLGFKVSRVRMRAKVRARVRVRAGVRVRVRFKAMGLAKFGLSQPTLFM